MKILFLVSGLNTRGGLQRVVTIVASGLSQKNEIVIGITGKNENVCYEISSKVEIRSFRDCGSEKNIWGIVRGLVRSGVKFPESFIRRSICTKRLLVNLEHHINEGGYDLVIGIGDSLPLTLALADRNNLYNKKILLFGWHHNTYEAYYCQKGRYSFGRKQIAKQLLPGLDQIITLTKRDASTLRKELLVKSTYIYDPLSFTSSVRTSLQTQNLLFVGRLEREQKGLDLLLEIAGKIFGRPQAENWHLILVGDGKDRKWVEQGIQKLNLTEYVSVVGSSNRIVDYYVNADLLLSTSRWEGFGMVITEAFECGLPVVSFLNNGAAEIMQDGVNGYLVQPFDTDVFADKTLELMTDDKKRHDFSEQAKQRAGDFSLDTIIKKWENVLEMEREVQ